MRPKKVTDAPPDMTVFVLTLFEMTGASNVKSSADVPRSEATVSLTVALPSPLGVPPHATVVADDHDVVVHVSSTILTVGVGALAPKLRPEIVTEIIPDVGELYLCAEEATGESNEKPFSLVPTSADTVIITLLSRTEPLP